ncbi:hypothetical protein COCCADRAFT_110585 [Bipolaris zeicola 26-R-13]|uniref:Uncharacterized protein n=1 Tax=Cochliobolus carbonum (strain 26-R-13) TaxID=930089 RepID=W6XYU7_COCC2|nr:uncharacterized protein COCCADRAFT_110585 [Bipolaris zeicola 26-R-13]EUC27884.1 hypothetical protein COCCADRAFT_110585 [Bipolaris zeicola 26-R-13]
MSHNQVSLHCNSKHESSASHDGKNQIGVLAPPRFHHLFSTITYKLYILDRFLNY